MHNKVTKYFTLSFSFSRSLLNHYGEFLGLDSKRVPNNPAASQFVEALAKAWTEYNNPRLELTQCLICSFCCCHFQRSE